MPQKTESKPVAHIYTFAISWGIMNWSEITARGSMAEDGFLVYMIAMLIICAIPTGIAYLIVRKPKGYVKSIQQPISSQQPNLVPHNNGNMDTNNSQTNTNSPQMATDSSQTDTTSSQAKTGKSRIIETSGNPEVDAITDKGIELLKGVFTVKSEIKNESVVQKVEEIIDTCVKIIDKIRRQPELVSSGNRFLNHYLPTTAKLVDNYHYMESQGVTGGNISETMKKIEDTLETLRNAYQNQLDTLFSSTALDLATDIDVLENILKQEGLAERDFRENSFQTEGANQ